MRGIFGRMVLPAGPLDSLADPLDVFENIYAGVDCCKLTLYCACPFTLHPLPSGCNLTLYTLVGNLTLDRACLGYIGEADAAGHPLRRAPSPIGPTWNGQVRAQPPFERCVPGAQIPQKNKVTTKKNPGSNPQGRQMCTTPLQSRGECWSSAWEQQFPLTPVLVWGRHVVSR